MSVSVSDYTFSDTVLGTGSFGRVVLGNNKSTGQKVAIKCIDKATMRKMKQEHTIENERTILSKLHHVNIVNMVDHFEDDETIYFALEVAEGGELFKYMERYGLEDMPKLAPNFIGECVLALEYLHSQGVIHRDIKPENMLLTDQYHLKLADFGTAIYEDAPTQDFTGTPEYVSPEVLTEGKARPASDLWALGCVIYQLFHGRPPFLGESQYLMFQSIKERKVEFSKYFTGHVRDLVEELLVVDPTKRLGAGPDGYKKLKAHPFFSSVPWSTLHETNNLTLENRNYTKEWKDYLLEDEHVVFTSVVIKRRYLSVKKRQLILTTHPRMFYIDLETNLIKGHVPWTPTMWAEATSRTQFLVHTPDRDWNFECFFENEGQTSELWVRKINSLLKK